MDLRVRRASVDDLAAIGSLRRAYTEEQAGTSIEDDGFEAELEAWFVREQHQRVTWLAEVGGRPVGMLNVLLFTRMPRPRSPEAPGAARRWGYVANAYVDPAHRDRGIGRALLDEVIAYADSEGLARLVLSPSERSLPFYQRAGFGPATSLLVRPLR